MFDFTGIRTAWVSDTCLPTCIVKCVGDGVAISVDVSGGVSRSVVSPLSDNPVWKRHLRDFTSIAHHVRAAIATTVGDRGPVVGIVVSVGLNVSSGVGLARQPACVVLGV